MAITNTIGGSGTYELSTANGPVILFTTPADIGGNTNAIFIVYLTWYGISTTYNSTVVKQQRIMVGPSTPVRIIDDTAGPADYATWHYTGMVIQ
jgi:hypothetical protein